MSAESIAVGDLYGRLDEDGDFRLARVTVVGPDTTYFDVVDHHGARMHSGCADGQFSSEWRLILHADVWHSYHGHAEKASDSDHQPPDQGDA